MSALTKIAVVLLVIASLLLSAGVIVFVNKSAQYQTTIKSSVDDLERERAAHRNATAQLSAAQLDLVTLSQGANARESALRKERDDMAAANLAQSAQITKAEQDKKAAEVNAQTIAAALKSSQEQNAAYQQQVAELRGIRDRLVEERHSLNTQLTDAIAKAAALETAQRNAEERANANESRYNELVARVQRAGFPDIAQLPQRQAGGPPLEGVITNTFAAGGKPWASISLGSKDNVAKGMKFNVHNNQEFLGYLTIQSAEPTNAAGVLEGPAIDKVSKGDQVKTQLQ